MKKFYFIFAAMVSVALTSCMNDEYVGDPPVTDGATNEGAIVFGGGASKLTRAEGATAAEMLKKEMKIYGVKKDKSTSNYKNVFIDYTVKYSTEKVGQDDYNDGWYYVGAAGNQTIKYWDWASPDYHFVAGSPVANFTYTPNATTGDIETATITGLGGRLNHSTTVASTTKPVYIADPKVVAKANYNSEVQFTFRAMQSKVRVGIYETIPGYKITSIQFYNNDATPVASNYITLNSATTDYFQGTTSATGTVTYNWTSTPASYSFTYVTTGLTKGKFWEGGQFTSGVPAINSTATNLYGSETDMASDGYFIVMPTAATTAAPLTITCDYTLTSLDGSNETIDVKGATATIPAAYTKWAVNTAYTYLFKITDNTNGKTDPDQPNEGLYPIVFDAAVANVEDGMVGTETTVSTPSITVYQDGNVVGNGITFKAGSIDVRAMIGTTDITTSTSPATTTWSYVALDGTSYDYSKDYEHLGEAGALTTWTNSKLETVATNKTYVIKVVYNDGASTPKTYTAYFVLVVGAAENGPANS